MRLGVLKGDGKAMKGDEETLSDYVKAYKSDRKR